MKINDFLSGIGPGFRCAPARNAAEYLRVSECRMVGLVKAGMPNEQVRMGGGRNGGRRRRLFNLNEAKAWLDGYRSGESQRRRDAIDRYQSRIESNSLISRMVIAKKLEVSPTTASQWMKRSGADLVTVGAVTRIDAAGLFAWFNTERPDVNRHRAIVSTGRDDRAGIIYAIVDPTDGKWRYIGKSSNATYRWKHHLCKLRRGKHANRHLQRWFQNLVGVLPSFLILQACKPGDMDEAESLWISEARDSGMPLCNIASGGLGMGEVSDEVRAKLSEISQRKWQDPIYRERHRAAMELVWSQNASNN